MISNLREVTEKENSKNKKIPNNNTSGHIGISWHKSRNKWSVQIGVDGAKKHIGLFINIDEAVEAHKSAKIKYGYHENHGKIL